MSIRNFWVQINVFWIRLKLVRFRFVKYRFVRYTLDLADTDIPFTHFICFQNVLKTCLARCLQDVSKTSWKTKNCYAEDVLKMSPRHVLKMSSRHVLKMSSRHVLKTPSRRLEDQQMFAGQQL